MTSMDYERFARGWALIAEGAMEISLAYSAIESSAPVRADEPVARTGFAGAGEAVSPQPSPVPVQDESAFTRCPAHNVPWAEGKFGKYCQQPSKDYPNWANDKGFCKVTPRSAGAWLRQHPRVAA